MTTTPVSILQEARTFLENPDRWCRHHFAVNEHLVAIGYNTPHAIACCSVGAVFRAANGAPISNALALLQVSRPKGYPTTAAFNDDPKTTHEDILAMFDRALQLEAAQ